jgi:hypothetical protein
MALTNYLLAAVPLAFPAWFLMDLVEDPLPILGRWLQMAISSKTNDNHHEDSPAVPPVGSQLLAYVVVAVFGYVVTNRLVPNIQVSCYLLTRLYDVM